MDPNKNNPTNPAPTQPGPIFESVSFDDVPQNLQPEEIPSVPPVDSGNAFLQAPPPELTGQLPPVGASGGGDNKKKILIIAGAVVIFLCIFGGVLAALLMNRGGGEAPEPVTLTYWGLWDEEQVLAPLIQEYQKTNPHVTIKYIQQTPNEYREKLLGRSPNGQGPDLFRYHNTWLPQVITVAAPVPAEIMPKEEFESTFYAIHQSDLKFQEEYYGIPLSIDGLVLVYNDNLFKKAGITAPPSSWIGDLLEAVNQLTVQDRDGNIVTSGIAMGSASNIDHFSEIFGMLLLQNGGSLEQLDSKQAAEALQVYREFAEKNIWNDTMPNSTLAFAQEKVAMIIVPSWQILNIKSINPEIQLKVAQVPRGIDGKPLSLASYWVEGVSKYSNNQVEAWKFLKFMSTKESQQKLFETQSKVRLFGTASARKDLSEDMLKNEYLAPIIQQADSYKTLPLADRTFDGETGVNTRIIDYLRNAVNSTANGVSYDEALKTAQSGVKQVLSTYTVEAETQQ